METGEGQEDGSTNNTVGNQGAGQQVKQKSEVMLVQMRKKGED